MWPGTVVKSIPDQKKNGGDHETQFCSFSEGWRLKSSLKLTSEWEGVWGVLSLEKIFLHRLKITKNLICAHESGQESIS